MDCMDMRERADLDEPGVQATERDPPIRERSPDGEVLSLVRDGNTEAALRLLMQQYGDFVYRYCRMSLSDTALADDVQQQVFVQAFHSLHNYQGRSSVRSWLFGIARHCVIDATRARCRAQARMLDDQHVSLAHMPDPRPSAAESLDDMRLRQALVDSLDELSTHARSALLLRYRDGFTFEEIAELCGEKAGTHQQRVARALPRLRQAIRRRLER